MKERLRRHGPVSNEEGFNKVARTRKDWNQFLETAGLVLGTTLAVIGLLYLKQRNQLAHEDWAAAVATVEDSRTHLVSRVDSMYGGKMLYEVQVLAAFSMNGSYQKRWITVEQPAKTLTSAQFEEAHWKGKQCIVRWNPSNPRRIAVELHQFPELR